MPPAAESEVRAMPEEALPLTAMEELFLWGDSPEYPALCYSRLRFKGLLDRGALQSAVRSAVDRHPLFRSCIAFAEGDRPRWVPLPLGTGSVDWQEAPLREEITPQGAIDLTREAGLRIQVRSDGERSELLFVMHHACADGGGFFQFLEDLVIAYALASGEAGPRHSLSPLDPGLLATRGQFGLTPATFLRALPDLAVGLLGVRQYLMRKPAPLVSPVRNEANPPAGGESPAFVKHDFEVEESERLRSAARRLGAQNTLNDLLTRDLFLALAAWRREENDAPEDDWLRLMIPVDLRTKKNRGMSAANVIGFVFLDRCEQQLADHAALLKGIHDELDLIKKCRLGLIFIGSLVCARWWPGGLRRQAARHRRLGTVTFSNIGKILSRVPLPRRDHLLLFGDAVLEGVDVLIPYSAGTSAGFAATSYARRLNLTLNFDPKVMTHPQAAELLNCWVARLRESSSQS